MLKNTTIQHSERLVTLETCDEMRRYELTKKETMTKTKKKAKTKTKTFREHPQRLIPETYDL